ncbi:hypothetical protein MVEN_00376400 [Mycena venus]|uniref:Uncharacterized protein n=1 Tax=Mycena venus TaxID=2733690 RepID=A0A8H7DA04_9AGAR|nr:hypothetical protein MVEN_00376400 [Mycena venus]
MSRCPHPHRVPPPKRHPLLLDCGSVANNCHHMSLLRHAPYFAYDARRLWLVYGLGLGFALLCDLIGIFALVRNHFGATAGFTDFLAATRNSERHDLEVRNAQGQRIRLRYGPLRNLPGRQAFAFPPQYLRGRGTPGLVPFSVDEAPTRWKTIRFQSPSKLGDHNE